MRFNHKPWAFSYLQSNPSSDRTHSQIFWMEKSLYLLRVLAQEESLSRFPHKWCSRTFKVHLYDLLP